MYWAQDLAKIEVLLKVTLQHVVDPVFVSEAHLLVQLDRYRAWLLASLDDEVEHLTDGRVFSTHARREY
jgi:hypothetical protein